MGCIGEGCGCIGEGRGHVGEGRGQVGKGHGCIGEGHGFIGEGCGQSECACRDGPWGLHMYGHRTWPGGCVGDTALKKLPPLPTSASLSPLLPSPQPLTPFSSMLPSAFALCHALPLLDMPTPSQMRPTHPSCAPAPATTSRMHCGPLQCVPTRFDTPRPFLMCRHHPRCIPHAFHVPPISCSSS